MLLIVCHAICCVSWVVGSLIWFCCNIVIAVAVAMGWGGIYKEGNVSLMESAERFPNI